MVGETAMSRVGGKVSLVTGAASGLGRADAIRLAQEGSKVVVTDIDVERGQAVADEINAFSPDAALFMRLDVREEPGWIDVIGQTVRIFGRLDVLANNAGVVVVANPESTTLDQFRFVNAVMSEGVFLGCKHAIPAMKASGGGSIINMSSIASHLGLPKFFSYCVAKGAVCSMTKVIAVHCQRGGYNIRCNSIHAGTIDTPMVRESSRILGIQASDHANGWVGVGQPEDVANLVLYLASDESRFVNGAELFIDNAFTVQGAL
jgi:3(or 17)beta-hydroxysteroid dehydrogenase